MASSIMPTRLFPAWSRSGPLDVERTKKMLHTLYVTPTKDIQHFHRVLLKLYTSSSPEAEEVGVIW